MSEHCAWSNYAGVVCVKVCVCASEKRILLVTKSGLDSLLLVVLRAQIWAFWGCGLSCQHVAPAAQCHAPHDMRGALSYQLALAMHVYGALSPLWGGSCWHDLVQKKC